MSNTFSVTVTSTEASPAAVTAQYAMVSNGALILSDDAPFVPFPGGSVTQVTRPKAIYASGQWQSAIATAGGST